MSANVAALAKIQKSQSHRTAQGNSKLRSAPRGLPPEEHSAVAIPPYCSGQFQVERTLSKVNEAISVAIPPYCSGQFQVWVSQFCVSWITYTGATPPYCYAQ